jgi:hypothetical protein
VLHAITQFPVPRCARRSAQAQNSPCDQIDAAKKKTYGYKSAELTDAGRKAKSDEMDLFWKLVKAQG